MKRDEGEELRSPQRELEYSSSDDLATALAEEPITRARALKLAGAALVAGTGLTALFQSPAEARRRRKRRRRRRRRRVTTTPEQPKFEAQPGASDTKTVEITNHQDGTSVYLLPDTASGNDFSVSLPGVSGPITEPIEIAPGATVPVEVTFSPSVTATPGDVQTGSLTLVDAAVGGEAVKVVPLEGTVLPL